MHGKGHTGERCPACKDAVAALLERCYGRVERNAGLDLPARLDEWWDGPHGAELAAIHAALGDLRSRRDCVRAARLAPVDFYVPDPGFIVEFDESQHFTAARAAALALYPAELAVGFPVDEWRDRCLQIDAHDDDPVYRDEQWAWYDTLRDFAPVRRGRGPTVRLYSRECEWCALDPDSEEDVAAFRALIDGKRNTMATMTADGDRALDALIEFEYLTNRIKLDYLDACITGTPNPDAAYFTHHGEETVGKSLLLNTYYGHAFPAYLGGTCYLGGGLGSVPFGPLFADRRADAETCGQLRALDLRIRREAWDRDDWLAILAEYVMVKVSIHELITDIADAPANYGQPDLAALLELAGRSEIEGTDLREALIRAHRLGLDPTAGYTGGMASPGHFKGLPYPEFMARRREWLGTADAALAEIRKRARRDGLGHWVSWSKNALCAYDAGPVFLRRVRRWLVPDVAAAFNAFDAWNGASDTWDTMTSFLSGPVAVLIGPYWGRIGGEGKAEEIQRSQAVAHLVAEARAGLEIGRASIGMAQRPRPSNPGEGQDAVRVPSGRRLARPPAERRLPVDSARRGERSVGDRDQFPVDDPAGQREVFVESIRRFAEGHRRSDETCRKTTAKDHHPRIDIDSWDRYGRARRPHYELVDWIRHGRDEVTVEFQCESGRCAGLAKAIEARAGTIADAMPGRPAPRPLEKRHGWLCLALVYPGTASPDEIAGGMRVLIDRSRPIVDAWLEAQRNA